MLQTPISITAIASISSLGETPEQVWESYTLNQHFLESISIADDEVWAGVLSNTSKNTIKGIRDAEQKYNALDDSVLYAIYTAREAIKIAGWSNKADFGVNIGSSRGATALFEKHHNDFLTQGTTATLASPTTTLGNIASWVAHDLKTKGPDISHSITCSTALHALLNGVAWITSGLTDTFLVGGSEAPLTPFTIAQMKALKIYSKAGVSTPSGHQVNLGKDKRYPCRALDMEKTKNTMVLGEGAAMACLEKGIVTNALAKVIGIGYATEPLKHNVSISSDAVCFQDSMHMALKGLEPNLVDVIVMHAPGTVKGDSSENNAIKKVFCNKIPFLTTNKWKVGHTFGASGMLSIEMAILMLQKQKTFPVPYLDYKDTPKDIQYVLVNAVGFGGNAVSILLSK